MVNKIFTYQLIKKYCLFNIRIYTRKQAISPHYIARRLNFDYKVCYELYN